MNANVKSHWIKEAFEPGLVTVIIPTFNRAGLIADTPQSVRAQTYCPIEVVVVDDGSTDGTPQVMERFAREAAGDLGVLYFWQANQGAPAAGNRGLAEAHGEFIQFLDCDDPPRPPQRARRQVGSPLAAHHACPEPRTRSESL